MTEQLWRYPIKSLKRESLKVAPVERDGIRGDRAAAVFVRAGHPRREKTYRGKEHHLLHTLESVEAAQGVARMNGVDLEMRMGMRYFDAAPISIVIDTWLREAESIAGRQLDPQRFRPNIFARAEPGFDVPESRLVGKVLRIGSVLLRVQKSIERCVTITYDVNSGSQDGNVLRSLALKRNNTLGIYCEVVRPGQLTLGDSLSIDGLLSWEND